MHLKRAANAILWHSTFQGAVSSLTRLISISSHSLCSPTDKPDAPESKSDAGATNDEKAASGFRSLSEVLGHKITPVDYVTKEDLALATAPRAAESEAPATSSTTPPGTTSTSQPAPQKFEELIHPQYGYAVVGGVIPKSTSTSKPLIDSIFEAQPRVHPKRTFAPGQTYNPEDLNPYMTSRPGSRVRGPRLMPGASEVQEQADYKNVAFLHRFLSPAGRMLSRRMTKLPVNEHIKVMRSIKLARNMGLIAGESRLEKRHVQRLREQEFRVQLEGVGRAAAGAATQQA